MALVNCVLSLHVSSADEFPLKINLPALWCMHELRYMAGGGDKSWDRDFGYRGGGFCLARSGNKDKNGERSRASSLSPVFSASKAYSIFFSPILHGCNTCRPSQEGR